MHQGDSLPPPRFPKRGTVWSVWHDIGSHCVYHVRRAYMRGSEEGRQPVIFYFRFTELSCLPLAGDCICLMHGQYVVNLVIYNAPFTTSKGCLKVRRENKQKQIAGHHISDLGGLG